MPAANAIDRMLLSIAPKWALSRIRARAIALTLTRHYEAATAGRRTENWSRRFTDANAAAGVALGTLRAHARDLVRNNSWARNGLRVITRNVVGWGISAKPEYDDAKLVSDWKRWSGTTECDAAGRLTFAGLQKLVTRCVAESGEVLVRRRWRRTEDGLAIPLQLQVLEPDFLDTSKHGIKGPAGGPIVHGVEFDQVGRRIAYWLFEDHPGSIQALNPVSRRLPASELLHVFDLERAGQERGVSWFAAAIVKLKDFDEFDDATLMRQKIAACFAAFVTDVDGAGAPLGEKSETNPLVETLEPGLVSNLPPGKSISFANPPLTTDDGFSIRTLRSIAASLGVTYEDLTGDYCVAPETRVLRADLRWVMAEDLVVGDTLVAFDEQAPGGRGQRRKWRKATVERAARRDLPRRQIVTDFATVTVSDEHLFLCTSRLNEKAKRGHGLQARSKNPSDPGPGQRWVRADRLRPGDRILFLQVPWVEGTSHAHGYLKGMADGEGYLDQRDAHLGIAQNPGIVFQETGAALRSLGFSPIHRNANGGGKTQQWSLTGIGDVLRFLGEVRPSRLLAKSDSVYIGRTISGGSKKHGRPTFATVTSVESIGVGPVVTLGTSTATLITEGLLSHNSQVNFSSARMSRLAHWGNVYDWQWNMLVPQFCDPAWRWAMEAAIPKVLASEQPPPGVEWTPQPMPLTEPDREARANVTMIRSGQKTLSQVIREQGGDPDSVLEEYAADLARLDELGIWLDSDVRRVSQAGLAQANPSKGGGASDGAVNGAANGHDAGAEETTSDAEDAEDAATN